MKIVKTKTFSNRFAVFCGIDTMNPMMLTFKKKRQKYLDYTDYFRASLFGVFLSFGRWDE